MIRGYACKYTERIFRRERARRWPDDVCRVAYRKLVQLEISQLLFDVRVPPGNRVEALKGDHKGQHSIRVNDQWWLCFSCPPRISQ